MRMHSLGSLSAVSILALAACGGNSGEGGPLTISEEENALRIYAEGNGDLSDVLEAGSVVYARSAAAAAKAFDYEADTSALTDVTVSMSEDTEILTITMNGKDFALDPTLDEAAENLRQIRYTDGSGYRDVFILTDSDFANVADESTGTGYAELFTAYFGDEDGDIRTFFVLGAETQDEALDLLESTVDFNGFAYVRIDPGTGWVNEPTSTIDLNANMTLTADFASQTLSGSLTELFLSGDGFGEAIDGSIAMNETEFAVNAFEGTLSPDEALQVAEPGLSEVSNLGTYSGAFYGPSAEEVGGVIVFEGADDEGAEFNAVGGFFGDNFE